MVQVRVPPHNLDAEISLIGSLLIDKDAIVNVASILKPDDFYKDTHKQVFKAILELFENRDPIDLVTVTDKLKKSKSLKKIGGSSYLASLVEKVPTSAHVEMYAKIVKDAATKRQLIYATTKLVESSFDESKNVGEILDEGEQAIFSLSQKHLEQNFVPIKDVLAESFDRLDELHKKGSAIRGVPTGFTDLDDALAGMQASNLLILAGRPGLGKTAIALNIAAYTACEAKMPVGFFSLEMSKEELVDRTLVFKGDIDAWRLKTGRLTEKDFTKLSDAMGELAEAPLYIDDTPAISILEMRTKARRLKVEFGLELLVMDYLQLARSSRRWDSRVQEVTEISQGLKNLARELKIPVLAVSQLSRAVETRGTKEPQLADLRESGCLTGDSLIINAKTGQPISLKTLAEDKSRLPLEVLSLDQNLNLYSAAMTKAFCSGKKEVYELVTQGGRRIKASANHPFYKSDGWTPLAGLKAGDLIAVYKNSGANKLDSSNILRDKIINIKRLGIKKVYDATVEKFHNFIANDIVVHNSIEQDADVVMFLYRKEDDELENVLLKIAKHRNGPLKTIPLRFKGERIAFFGMETKRSK
jgi:replicative DNA helicase